MEPNAMDTQRRTMLAIGISLLLWMLYMTFFAPKPADVQPLALADGGTPAQVATPPQPAAEAADAGAVAQAPSPGAEGQPAAEPEAPVQELTRQTENTIYGLSTEGAALTRAELQGPKMREQEKVSIAEGFKRLFGGHAKIPPQMDMGRAVPGAPKPLAISIDGARPFDANARYRVEEGADGQTLTFTARQGQTEIVKVLQFAKTGFEGAMTVTVKNRGGEALQGELGVHYIRGVEPGTEEKASLMGGVGNESHAACSVAGDKVHRLVPGQEDSPPTYEGSLEFFGVDQQYFVGAVFPLEGARQGRCTLTATPSARSVVGRFPLNVPAGQETTFKFGVYVGPKLNEMLESVPDRMVSLGLAAPAVREAGWAAINAESRYPHLEKSIDYGWWAFISRILLVLMRWFETVFANWGVAIILLTVTVKLILLPLTHKSMVSAENMKKLQPKMEEIRKKFADDKNRQNVEMMKLYQEAKVNPLGGCLPMLIQMPVWIALFTTLRNSYEIYREPFIAPIWMDLTYKDPTYLLPILLGVTMIITQKLQPQMVDPVQAKMMTYVMPVFFTAIMLNYPAGLSLYILTNNLLSIAQQYGLKKWLARKAAVAPVARGAK